VAEGTTSGTPMAHDARVLWVEAGDDAIHVLDGLFAATDGWVNVRREYLEEGSKKLFKVFVAPGYLSDAMAVLARLRARSVIGEVRVEP